MVVYALGMTANPIIAQSTPGLKVNRWGYIEIEEKSGMTSVPGVFAGGDIVTGAAAVILAMGAGRRAARGMQQCLGLMPLIDLAALQRQGSLEIISRLSSLSQ